MPDYAMMPAGPETNALVAEKVVGECEHDWHADEPGEGHRPEGRGWICLKCGMWSGWDDRAVVTNDYSADIAAAWEVVETMKAQHQKRLVLKEYSDGWYAAFGKRPDDTLWQAMQCDTAPLAICRAALMAVEKGKDDGETTDE